MKEADSAMTIWQKFNRPQVSNGIRLLFVFCLCWSIPFSAVAQEMGTMFPSQGKKPKSGFRLFVGSTWSNAEGYRGIPILIEDDALVDTTVDREFEIRVSWQRNRWSSRSTIMDRSTTVKVTIPAGRISQKAYAFLPQSAGNELEDFGLNVQTFYQSRLIPELSRTSFDGRYSTALAMPNATMNASIFRGNEDDFGYSTMVVDSKIASLERRIKGYFLKSDTSPTRVWRPANQRVTNSTVPFFKSRDMRQVLYLPPDEMPTTYLGLSCFRRIVLTWNEFKSLKANQPDTFAAVKDWTAAGGVLYVTQLQSVKKSTNFAQNKPSESPANFKEQYRNRIRELEQVVEFKASEKDNYWRIPFSGFSQNKRVYLVDFQSFDSLDGIARKSPPEISRQYVAGEVIAVRQKLKGVYADLDAQNQYHDQELQTIDSLVGESIENPSGMANFVIPGVGEPPANTFRILITLFFAIVGPLNYILLRRWKKLNLLLFTLPLCAGIACLSLLIYAFIADGVVTHGRAISYTKIDQDEGRLVSHSRQAIFNAYLTSEGYVFPTDTLAFPMISSWPRSTADIAIENGVQRHRNGNIGTRSVSSFATHRSAETSSRLNITKTDAGVSVENLLRTDIQLGVVADDDGKIYKITDLKNGKTAEFSEVTAEDVTKLFRQEMVDRGHDGGKVYSGLSGFLRNRFARIWGGTTAQTVGSRRYIMMTEVSPEVPIPLKNITLNNSMHIIEGNW